MKFNPLGLTRKIIQPESIEINFQDFRKALRQLNDKKAHGVDGLPVLALKKIGYIEAFR